MARLEQNSLLHKVKQTVQALEPGAEVKLYGSRSRQEAGPDSDWDFLVLVEGPVGDSRADTIRHQLYEIEWESGEVLNVIVRSREEWNSPLYAAMPFRKDVERDGILL
jgi:predicted nucleotidyltransferase